MKRILIVIVLLVIGFLGLLYWSLNSSPTVDANESTIIGIDDVENTDFTLLDSVTITASNLYASKGVKELMQGEHYRKAWATPVKVPVVFLDDLKGGLKPIKEGGGKQTRSLKLEAEDEVLYTMRSIRKYPDKLVPDYAKKLGIENIVIDGISAQHPYASIVVARLAERIDLESTHPQAIFVPRQDALGKYDKKYGNALYMFEYESDSEKNWTKYPKILRMVDTEDLQELKSEYGPNLSIDRSLLVRARLFDMVIGDWDRHAEQWGWALQKQDNKIVALPVPADRDNAFFSLDGILPSIVSNKYVEPELRPFEESIDYMPGLVKPFDAYFLHGTPENIFVEQAQFIESRLTDAVVREAFNVWSKELFELDGEDIISKIISRRNNLTEYAKDFRAAIEKRGLLDKPLKGSDDKDIKGNLIKCFECADDGTD